MKTLLAHSLLIALTIAAPLAAQAAAERSTAPGTSQERQKEVTPLTEGEVKKVDVGQGKITIKHGAIENLDMPPMTMVFRVKDAAMLSKVKPGDAIKFTADRVDGTFTVTKLESGS